MRSAGLGFLAHLTPSASKFSGYASERKSFSSSSVLRLSGSSGCVMHSLSAEETTRNPARSIAFDTALSCCTISRQFASLSTALMTAPSWPWARRKRLMILRWAAAAEIDCASIVAMIPLRVYSLNTHGSISWNGPCGSPGEVAPKNIREMRITVCRAARCSVCGKTTWAGCGQHVASVRQSVPASQWCGGKHSPREVEAAREARASKGFFARLFGR